MFKKLFGVVLVATSTISLIANERNHIVDFDQVKFEASGRNLRQLISTAEKPTETFAYTLGQAKLTDGVMGQAIDLSDTRSRTEFMLKTAQYYNFNEGFIAFDIAPLKKNFGVTADTTVFEENNGETSFGLYIDVSGKLKLKVSAKLPLDGDKKENLDKYNDEFFKKLDKPEPVKFDTATEIDKATKTVEDNKKKEEEAKKAPKATYQIKDFTFHSFNHGDTSNWNINEFNNIVVSWDLRKGFFVVLLNGKYAIRSYATDGNNLGLYLDRGKVGEYIIFGKGNDGFAAKIDNIVVGKTVQDTETVKSK